MKRTIFLADVLRACHELGVRSPEEQLEVAGLLGFELPLAPEVQAEKRPALPKVADGGDRLPQPRNAAPAKPREERLEPRGESPTVPLTVESFSVPPRSSGEIPATGFSSEGRENVAQVELPEAPSLLLLKEREAKGLISELISSSVEAPPIDIERLVSTIARSETLHGLPFGRRRTLAKGCDVLVDLGASLRLLAADRDQILNTLRLLLSQAKLEISVFRGSPERLFSLEGEKVANRRWRWAVSRRPVLILSDFGVVRPFGMGLPWDDDAWLEFLERLQNQGRPVIGLIPFPPSRWPRELARRITLIKWDRSLTIGKVRKALFLRS